MAHIQDRVDLLCEGESAARSKPSGSARDIPPESMAASIGGR
jgi:hypothetical protein